MWIFRGQGIPPIMLDECYDLELYNWTKVDIADLVRGYVPWCLRLLRFMLHSLPAATL